MLTQPRHLRVGALVMVADGVVHRLACLVHQRHGVGAAQADGGDAAAVDALLLKAVVQIRLDGVPPAMGVLLGPGRLRVYHGVLLIGVGNKLTLQVINRTFRAGSADVDAQQQCFVLSHI